ncbi:MAG: DNA-binding response regulator [Anaerolineaceae bacterium]|nr:DNA-binding response regulator [Anaerolineaceae bacterium]
MINLLLVDDQKLIRQGIQLLLETEADLKVIGQAENGKEAVQLAQTLNPDVILMDVRMPEMDGVLATQEILKHNPRIGIIILTTFDDDETIFEGLKAGARGYLLKDISSEEMAAAVRTVAAGQALIQPSITRKVLSEFSRMAATPQNTQPAVLQEPLTEREKDVLTALANGLSNKEIAQLLFITEGTVKNHVSNLIAKLEVRDRTQAVLKAQTLNLI